MADHVRSELAWQESQGRTAQSIEQIVRDKQLAFGSSAIKAISQRTQRELLGVGPLQQYLDDPLVTDILINNYDDAWIDKGIGLERVESGLSSPAELRNLAVRLAAACGTRLDDSSPSVDGQLPDGTRLHAILHPLCASSAMISLRVLRTKALSMEQLIDSGTVHPHQARILENIIKTRKSFLVSGATGTGKTTLLSALLSLVPHTERILIIEESREIKPSHPHVVSLETKKENIEGKGLVDQSELLRNALRMRPDRVVVGECRGREIVDMLSALNTGHEGGCGTIHANSAQDVCERLHALGMLAGLPRETTSAQAGAAFDMVIHVKRQADSRFSSSRFIEEIAELTCVGQELRVAPIARWKNRQQLEVAPPYVEWLTALAR